MQNWLKLAHANLHRRLAFFVLLSPLWLQMCSADQERSSLRMVNGQAPLGENPASFNAVALIDPKSGESFCSGSIIAPNLVMTAAHCIFDKRPDQIEVLLGRSVSDPAALRLKVSAKDTFKKFQKFESNFDIAWVKLEAPVPAPFRPLEIWHQSDYLKAKAPITIAGYGREATECAPGDSVCEGGRLLKVDTTIDEFVNQQRLFSLIVVGPQAEKGPCFGDSGGPAYIQAQGKWYIAGDFMGWDRLLVPEVPETICDTGHAIYNFVGNYVNWIEESSNVRLAFDPVTNPREEVKELAQLVEAPKDFAGWCAYDNHEDPAWFTAQRIIRMASDFRIKTEDPSKARELFEDCAIAEEWVRKMIKADPKLVIPGFDPANFIDSARLEDVRPLASLADMGLSELVLSDHSIADLSPLAQLTSLKRLEIVDNVLPSRRGERSSPILRVEGFSELEDLRIHNSIAPIDLNDLSALRKLKHLELSYIPLDRLDGLDALPIERLSLENLKLPAPLNLTALQGLRALKLEKLAVARLPDQLPLLEKLELLEVTGLSNLPLAMPQLRRFYLYASDYAGSLDFQSSPLLEEVSIVANKNLQSIAPIRDLAALNLLEINENSLPRIEMIGGLPLLRELSLGGNGLLALPRFENLPSLEKIDLDSNQIASLGEQSFAACPRLVFLNLNRNPLVDLKGLSGLPALRRLSIQNEKGKGLKSLAGLADLPEIQEINLARNALTSVAELASFSQLQVLVLSDNLLSDLSPLRGLNQLEYLEVINNPLKDRTCPSLKPDVCRFEWGGIGDAIAPPS